MAHAGTLYLYETSSVAQAFSVEQDGLDVLFPRGIGWTDVLDCRIAPYTGQSIEANCDFAIHVRKRYILVTGEQVANSTPPTADAD